MDDGASGRGVDRDAPTDWPAETTDVVERADVARLVWKAVDEIRDDVRAVLVLRDVEQMASKEVATVLGISDSTVRQRLHRGRQIVAERLQPELCACREMTCGGQLDLLFDYIDEELADETRETVQEHIALCDDCQGHEIEFRAAIRAPLAAVPSLVNVDTVRRWIARLMRDGNVTQ